VKRADGNGDVYAYDAINQLTNVLYEASNPDTSPSAWTNEARYAFDPAGNRTSVTLTSTGTTSYTANNVNQYTAVGGITPTYDANGNLTYDGTWTYTWDRENRLIQAANGSTTISYAYDALHRLIKRTVGASETRFYYDDQWRLVEERDENDAVLAKYVYGPEIDEPVRMTRNNADYYYHAAALGTVTEITSSIGNLVEQYRYDIYGEPLSSSVIGNRLLFDGRDRDPDTGLYNIRYRWYSPSLGRWPSRDPIGERGGLNLHVFVGNNPINKMDPAGLWYDSITAYYRGCAQMHAVGSQRFCDCVCAPITTPDTAQACKDDCYRCADVLGKGLGGKKIDGHSWCLCLCQQANKRAKKGGSKCVDCEKACKFLEPKK
jgi:RHS repeat-associated protein